MNISLIDYLNQDKEELPVWLRDYGKDTILDMKEVLKSRVCYYPGAGFDGKPIWLFNKANSVHLFIYVDYLMKENETSDALDAPNAFTGYHLIGTIKLSKDLLLPNGFKEHITSEEKNKAINGYKEFGINPSRGYAYMKIFERNPEFDEKHGAFRFAIIYLGADAITTYDALFGNKNANLYSMFLQDYGFGCQYEHFGEGTLLERIAERTNSFPKYIISYQKCYMWKGYDVNPKVAPVISGNKYFVFEKGLVFELPEDLKNILIFSDDDNEEYDKE